MIGIDRPRRERFPGMISFNKNEQTGADVLKNPWGEVSLTGDVSLFYCVYLKFTFKIERSHATQTRCNIYCGDRNHR